MDQSGKEESEQPSVIDLTEKTETAYWMKNLGITEERLRALVSKYGNSVEAIMTAAGK